ncbi:MAG: hypothetical protein ACOYOE_10440 [Chlorobium sp.]
MHGAQVPQIETTEVPLIYCVMKRRDQRGNDVAVLRMVVIADAVEADRHDAAVIGTVFAVVVALTPFDARNFRGSLTL